MQHSAASEPGSFPHDDAHSQRTAPGLDLTACDREPIHIPGSIQPHGLLLRLTGPDLRIAAVSANVADHLGIAPANLLDVPLAELLDAASVAAIVNTAAQETGGQSRLSAITLKAGRGSLLPQVAPPGRDLADFMPPGSMWRGFVQAGPDGVLLEVELPKPPSGLDLLDFLDRYDGATRRLQAATDFTAICRCLAEEIRRLTGYDRVKIYRFAADWHGEVVAESQNGRMPSYLGLHFPASDIPAQARALYTRNPERQIPDVGYVPVKLLARSPAPVDLSQAMLRSVSPVHVEYLQNMQVAASMSVSIMRQGVLWGMAACHNQAPHYVAPEQRQASVMLAQLASWQLAVAEENDIMRRSVGVKAVEALLLAETASGRDYRDALMTHSSALLELLQATGFALRHGGSLTTLGAMPAEEGLRGLLDWLAEQGGGLFETDHLAAHYPPAAGWADAAGLIAVSLGGASANLLLWFRPEIARTVTWGGDPAKPAEPGATEERLTPRTSFAAWTEAVHGRSRPWARHEIAAANGLRDMIVDVILRRSAELEHVNAELVRTNEELEAFAYVASHDLKEPLRQIETFGTLLERVFRNKTASPRDVTRWFDGIQSSSRRLRTLINDLAEYSRLGRHANPFAPVPLDTLLDHVTTDLGSLIDENEAFIQAADLPTLMCDTVQMRQVFQNLIQNAIKYRHPDRAPVVRIAAEIRPPSNVAGAANLPSANFGSIDISIADNGIGFDERYKEQIFEPFQRLHSADEFEGSGIGLAICRKIVERHRGSIAATSRPGLGSTFTITMPMRPLPAANAPP